MKREVVLAALFTLVTAVAFYLFYKLVAPYFAPIAWAAVMAIVFFPLYEKLRRRRVSRTLAALLMCLLVMIVIVGPMTWLFVALMEEAAEAVADVNAMYQSGRLADFIDARVPLVQSVKETLARYVDVSSLNLDEVFREAIDRIGSLVFDQTSEVIASGARTVFHFLLMVFTLYYFFKDGERAVAFLRRLTPLPPDRVGATFEQLRDIIHATMYGGLTIAALQGLVGGLLFALVGLPSPVFWGAVMGFLSVLPMIGAFIVYVPAGLILILGGAWVKGVVVLAVGVLIISQIDNFLRPVLISGLSRQAEMHPLLLFFSILGGVSLVGLLGLVVGPLIAAVFITLLSVLEQRLHHEETPPAPPATGAAPANPAK